MRITRNQTSLAGQVLAVNVLMVVATLFAATAAANLNLRVSDQRFEFTLLALTIVLVLLVNIIMLRRRFSPLERLIEQIEAIDPAQVTDLAGDDQPIEEIDRLAASFRRMLGRLEAERRRSGRLVLRAQEALANVARHASASRVELDLNASPRGLELTVEDDGRGFDTRDRHRGLGLDGMAERARLVGGELTIASAPGAGTRLSVRVP